MTISEIKTKLSILTVLHHYGLRMNTNAMLACPFHDDQKASMKIYRATNTVYCFAGSCEIKNLDAIDFIMKKESCTKHEALQKAKTFISEALEVQSKINFPIQTISKDTMTKTTNKSKEFTRYQKSLLTHEAAQTYLKSRKLDWQKLEIGYKSRKTKEPWGRACIIFPLKNEQGEMVSLYGRSTLNGNHFYEGGREGLYPKYPNPTAKKIVLCESIIDASTLLQLEPSYEILALFGTNGLTKAHQEAIKNLVELEEIIFALDGDEAGRAATKENANVLLQLLPRVKITTLNLPEGEDINSLSVAHEDVRALLNHLFGKRTEVGKEVGTTNGIIAKTLELQEVQLENKLNTANPHNIIYPTKTAKYLIKGGIRFGVSDFDHMKITLVIEGKESRKSRQKLDLYEDKQVEKVSRIAANKLGLNAELVELDLQLLTDELEAYREELHLNNRQQEVKKIEVTATLRSRCLDFLKEKNLLQRINKMIGETGITGEENNRLLLFVVASSFKMPHTLHALIHGASGSGKTRLLQIISDLMPDEEVKRYTRVTDSSFYNQGEYFFKNKLICLEDIDGLKEDALLAVRELQSNEILITSTSVKDEQGRISGGERVVRGPIASISCTTKAGVYEDNISRCFVVAVDESKAQNLRVIEYQNNKSAGVIDGKDEGVNRVFLQNVIRLLQTYEVVNPFANKIKLPQDAHKIRRLNELYQSFVRQITLLNQFQRKQDKRGRLITEKEDLKIACEILFESIVLKVDELDGSLRQFFEQLKKYVEEKGNEHQFDRFEIKEATGQSKTSMHRKIKKLVELEYLKQFGFGNRGYRYKIAHWDNMKTMRNRIKESLDEQLEVL
jgi:energy-coupling factor transporter ATP-binding protein EcfA2